MKETHIYAEMSTVGCERFELGGLEAIVSSVRKPDRTGPNEDAAALIRLGNDAGVAVVSDGAGGHPDAAKAAALAVHAICDSVGTLDHEADSLRSAIINGFEAADRSISALGTGAAATLAVVEIQRGTVRAYHAGDSVVLVTGQRGRIKQQNVLHSPVGYAVEAGVLDREDALHHEDLHIVSNLLGGGDMRIELGAPLELRPRDTVLLATDGLSDNVRLEEIVGQIRKGPLSAAAERLVKLGIARMEAPEPGAPSKPDDLTLILMRRRSR
jgi:serine/threonine protein phosphatase PrpC